MLGLTRMSDVAVEVSVNGNRRPVSNVAELRAWLDEIRVTPYLEVWLSRPGGAALAILTNRARAWLMYLRHEGDAGYSSRNPAYRDPEAATLDFYLSNGQRDEYPAAWTIPTEAAFDAAEHFFISGEMDPSVTWHDDSATAA